MVTLILQILLLQAIFKVDIRIALKMKNKKQIAFSCTILQSFFTAATRRCSATFCNILLLSATFYCCLQHFIVVCNILLLSATFYCCLQHFIVVCNILLSATFYCFLQHFLLFSTFLVFESLLRQNCLQSICFSR